MEQDQLTRDDGISFFDFGGKPIDIKIKDIDLSQNYRKISVTSDEFMALKESILLQGLMQPPIVTKQQSENLPYLCVAGHRRITALRELGFVTAPCMVLKANDPAQIEAARLAENIVREDLKPLELANALKSLKTNLNISSKGLSRILNKDRAYLSRVLRIADWPDDIKEQIRQHNINMRPLFLLAAKNLPHDDIRKEVKNLIDHKKSGLSLTRSNARFREVRDNYFKTQFIPESVRYWILKFLRDNKIRGWFEDTL